MKSSTWVSLPLIFFFLLISQSYSLSSISPFSQCSQSVAPQGDADAQRRGSGSSAQLSKHTNTSIFPSPWLYPCFTCTHLNQKEHISQHKWVKQVILKHSWAGKEGCLNSTDFHLVLRFLLRIFVAFYVYAQHFSIIDCSMNIPQQKCRGSNGCVRLTSAGKNIRANQLSASNVTVEKKEKKQALVQLMAPCNSQMQKSLG